jgi:long-chain acyl-CoA synthetase
MLIEDFSIETVEVGGYPIQTFKKRFRNIWEMFINSSITFKDDIYLIEGQNRLTFGQTADMTVGLAGRIKAKTGADRGDHIGILMENSIRFILVFWAVQSLGATAVIFNTRLAPPELKRQLQFSDLKVLLSSPVLSEKAKEIPPGDLNFQQVVFSDDWLKDLPIEEQTPPSKGIAEDDTAYILFTSGTSGTPKGVMVTHRNIITSAFKIGYNSSQNPPSQELPKGQYSLVAAPLFHVMALQGQLIPAVFFGRGIIVVPSFNPEEVVEMVKQGKITGLTGTPTMYWLLLNKTDIRRAKTDSIKRIGFGAAPMPPDLLKELRRVFPLARFGQGYGMTEASFMTALEDEFMETHPTSVGKPTPCAEVKIVDPLSREEVGRNEVGEVAVRGALVTKGYYKAPEETAKVYQQGWLFTGDMAYQDDEGFFYIVGRTREMINRGGENVYPGEVENVLHLHSKVLDVAVFGLPDPVMGSIVACAVIPKPDTEKITMKEIQEFCGNQLASYKIPQRVFFLPDLPRNPGGKVMKNKLVDHLAELKI